MLNLKDSSKGYAAIEIIVYSILPILVLSLVPAGFQAIQKQLAAESIVRLVARELMISKSNNPETEAALIASEVASEFGYPADLSIRCIRNCDQSGGWYQLQLQIDSASAKKVAVIEG